MFAAEALDGSQLETYGWAGLFLALLAAGELALDHYRDTHRALWRWIAGVLGGLSQFRRHHRHEVLAGPLTASN